jgi:ABC-type cobalamin/Fe3+-siderophores transport system ATPase subunit
MDLGSEAAIVEFLRDLNGRHGVTILLVTHLLPLVLTLATSIMLFARGTIVQGALADVLHEERLTAVYGVPVHLGTVAGRPTLVVGAREAR